MMDPSQSNRGTGGIIFPSISGAIECESK